MVVIAELGFLTILVLVVIAFLSGIGITAIGPGGIFVTISLFILTPASPGTVAGTASATFIVAGILGSAAYWRSGELRTGDRQSMVALLSLTGMVGAILGVWANAMVTERTFGILLGTFVSVIGAMVLLRNGPVKAAIGTFNSSHFQGQVWLGFVGFGVGVPAGLLGVGGPVLAVPLLVLGGTPILVALAVAQVQSIGITMTTTAGYLTLDAVSVPLAILVGIPEFVGVIAGWKLAHKIDHILLERLLGLVLVFLGPYIALA